MIDFLKNIKISLKAVGPAAVLCTCLICMAAVAIFAEGDRPIALSFLFLIACAFIGVLPSITLDSEQMIKKPQHNDVAQKNQSKLDRDV